MSSSESYVRFPALYGTRLKPSSSFLCSSSSTASPGTGTSGSEFYSFHLEQNEILYIPRGFVHRTFTCTCAISSDLSAKSPPLCCESSESSEPVLFSNTSNDDDDNTDTRGYTDTRGQCACFVWFAVRYNGEFPDLCFVSRLLFICDAIILRVSANH